MPKFLRKLEFEKVIKALWNTSKSRFIEEVSFDDATQILSQTKDGQTEEVADLTIYAKKDEENHFTESNLFKDVFLETLEPYIDNLGSYTNFAGGVKKTGRRDFTSHSNGNDGYVKSLLIRLSNGMGAGSKTNVSVWEVEKGLTTLDDVANKIVDNVQVDVLEYGGIKYIEVPIYKKYENPTYFIFQISPSADMAYYQSPTNMEDYIYIDGDVYISSKAVVTMKHCTVNGNIYVLGGLRLSGVTGKSLYANSMVFYSSSTFSQGMVQVTGSNTFSGSMQFETYPVADIPIRVDSVQTVDGLLYMSGAVADIADMYIGDTQIDISNNGKFVVEDYNLGAASKVTLTWKTVFGNTITKDYNVEVVSIRNDSNE